MKINFRPLNELCTHNVLKRNMRLEPEKEFWYIDISSINNLTKEITSPTWTKGSQASVRARHVIFEDDVLVSTTRPNLNAVSMVPVDFHKQICSTGFCVLRCGSELDPSYLFHFVGSQTFIKCLDNLVQGALYPAVTNKQVFAQCIPWVPLREQRQIAAHLKAQLAEVEKARQAAEAQLVDASFLVSRHQEVSLNKLGNAPRVSLGELLLGIEAGKSFKTTDMPARPDELGILKVSAVSWNKFQPQEAKSVEGDYQPDERHRVKRGDLIISRANTMELVGAVVRVPEDYPLRLLSDKTLRLVTKTDKVLPDYLLTVLKWPEARAHIENNATGSSDSMRNISQKTIRSIPVPLLSKDEQQAIINSSKAVNHELDQIQGSTTQMLNDLALLPQKILAQAFSMTSGEGLS